MKTIRLIVLGAVLTGSVPSTPLQAQVYSPKRITQRVAPSLNPTRTNEVPRPLRQGAPSATSTNTNPQVLTNRALTPRPVYRVIRPPQDPEKVRASKEDAVRRTVEFQKKRASEGSGSAQYELGMRYLKGDGVEKDEDAGRKWLESSAKSGYRPAVRKLEELDKPAEPPKPN